MLNNRLLVGVFSLLLLHSLSFGCACITSISCAPVKATMSASTKFIKSFITKFDNKSFTEQFAKKTLWYLYMAKKKKQEIARNYERRKVLLKEMNIINQEEAFLNENITKIPYVEAKALSSKANALLLELKMIENAIDTGNAIDNKMISSFESTGEMR